MAWSRRDVLLNLVLLLAIVASVVVMAGWLDLLRGSACDRLNDERVSHLEPGHDSPGPGSIYVIGEGPGPPPSELVQYYEAEAAMERSGCEGTGKLGPGD